jgi:hypothetical protein
MTRIKGFVIIFEDRISGMTLAESAWRPRGRLAARLAAAGLMLAAAACTGAQEGGAGRGAAVALGLATTTPQPKDFVVARRSGAPLEYIPVGRGGIERPVQPRDVSGVRALEADLDATRDRSEAFARRQLPSGAYGQALPSVAAPPRAARAAGPGPSTTGSPESFPVNPDRARRMREDARAVRAAPN